MPGIFLIVLFLGNIECKTGELFLDIQWLFPAVPGSLVSLGKRNFLLV